MTPAHQLTANQRKGSVKVTTTATKLRTCAEANHFMATTISQLQAATKGYDNPRFQAIFKYFAVWAATKQSDYSAEQLCRMLAIKSARYARWYGEYDIQNLDLPVQDLDQIWIQANRAYGQAFQELHQTVPRSPMGKDRQLQLIHDLSQTSNIPIIFFLLIARISPKNYAYWVRHYS
ncbi:hypothetical protein JCM14202_1649 [Agrilactobacillus composti DSM 18527 = JCM 14202]|nr:hypothetical protein [Agrilactobacillus composti]GAF39774.1 hypothetical protein JCM14202_1649 [Agrilactobacillus composti DSM 18527 = JCM 14202]